MRKFIFALFITTFIPLAYADEIQKQILSTHNQLRTLHHAPNLIWDDKLANYAKNYANYCKFEHSHGKYGENLAAGYPSILSAIHAWYDENKSYSYSFPGFSSRTGHFTQVVWKSTRHIGCALSDCNGKNGTPGEFLVCEYYPAGNVTNAGYFAENVSKPILN